MKMRLKILGPVGGLLISLLLSACEAPGTLSLPSIILAASSGELSNSSSNFLADYSLSSSLITLSTSKIAPGQTAIVTVSLKNPALLPVISASPKVYIYTYGGTSQGYFSPLTNHHDGTYSAVYTALSGGSANSIHVKVDDHELNPAGGLPALIISGGAPQFMEIVSGNTQSGPSTFALTLPLLVRVRDASNTPLAALPVTWQVVSGGGTLSSSATPTDSNGLAQINFTFGPLPGVNKLKASIYGTPLFVIFVATATAIPFQETWTLSQMNQSDLTFDPSKIDFNSTTQSCELKKSKQSDEDNSVQGFSGGTLSNVFWDVSRSSLRIGSLSDENQIGQGSWTPQSANLISVWHLDEAAGTSGPDSVIDSKGFALGSPSNLALGSGGVLKTAASFNGTSSAINLGQKFDFTTTPFTFSYWINLSTFVTDSPYGPVPFFKGPYNDRGYYNQIGSTGSISFSSANGGNYQESASAPNVIKPGRWQHVAITRTGASVKIFVDGVEVTQSRGNHALIGSSSSDFYLGLYPSVPVHMRGSMDEVAVWSSDLTAGEVASIYARQSRRYNGTYTSRIFDAFTETANFTDLAWKTVLPSGKELPSGGSESTVSYSALDANLMSGIVGLWHLNEPAFTGTPNEVIDSSGNGNHGLARPGVLPSGGKLGSSAKFNGASSSTDDLINYGNISGTNFGTGDFTLSTWVKTAVANRTQILISKRSQCGHDNFYNLYTANGSPSFEMDQDGNGSNYSNFTAPGFIADGEWHLITATRNQTLLNIFIDGRLNRSVTAAIAIINNTANFSLNGGPCAPNSNGFDGQMDEVAVWSRALQANEIKQLYLRGTNRLKFQVRACTAADCSDDATDAKWKGTDGTSTTYFSELNNNSAPRTGLGSVNASSPRISFADFTAQSLPARFFQYRVNFETEDTRGLCDYGAGFEPCSPELQSVSLGPTHDYDSSSPTVVSKNGFPYLSLSQFSETLGQACPSGVRYNLGVGADSTTASWFYFNPSSNSTCSGAGGGSWCPADGSVTKSSSAPILASNVSSFRDIAGVGKVFVKAFLGSSGSSACALDAIGISGLK